jgi:hypothetical protein
LCYHETIMKNPEQVPWGQNLEKVDAAREQMKEEAILKASEKSRKIAEYTETIKKRIREGDMTEVENILNEIYMPATKNEFGRDYNVLRVFMETTFEEVKKKYGMDTMKKILASEASERLRRLERA